MRARTPKGAISLPRRASESVATTRLHLLLVAPLAKNSNRRPDPPRDRPAPPGGGACVSADRRESRASSGARHEPHRPRADSRRVTIRGSGGPQVAGPAQEGARLDRRWTSLKLAAVARSAMCQRKLRLPRLRSSAPPPSGGHRLGAAGCNRRETATGPVDAPSSTSACRRRVPRAADPP